MHLTNCGRRQSPRDINTKPNIFKEGNILFNDAVNTFYLLLYGVGRIFNDMHLRMTVKSINIISGFTKDVENGLAQNNDDFTFYHDTMKPVVHKVTSAVVTSF